MRIVCSGRIRPIVLARFAMCFSVVWLLSATSLFAQLSLMRIEEDWELELIQPDSRLDAPQALVVFSPHGDSGDGHFEVDINHASLPAYSSGGLQIRAMQGSTCIDQKRLLGGERLAVESDVIRWTQIVEQQPGGYAFGIIGGTSSSWGPFGDTTTYVTLPSVQTDFAYSPENSLSRSGVTYAGNRVKRLTLCKIRYIDALGNTTEIPVDQSIQ